MLIRSTRRDIARVKTVLSAAAHGGETGKPPRTEDATWPAKLSRSRTVHADAGRATRQDQAPRADRRRHVSDKMQKTVRRAGRAPLSHAQYSKYMTKRAKYKAHDEKNEYKIGDRVSIVESRPLSRDKRWRVEKLIERAARSRSSEAPETENRVMVQMTTTSRTSPTTRAPRRSCASRCSAARSASTRRSATSSSCRSRRRSRTPR